MRKKNRLGETGIQLRPVNCGKVKNLIKKKKNALKKYISAYIERKTI